MKKITAIVIVLVLVLALAVPALAADPEETVITTVQVSSSGEAPIIKAKWETPDADPLTAGTQVAPVPGTYDPSTGATNEGCVTVSYWAVVTHPLGIGAIDAVYVDVFHPELQRLTNIVGDPVVGEWCGSFKYEVELNLYEEASNASAIAAFQAAYDAGLVTFGPMPGGGFYDAEDVIEEINQTEAEVYKGVETLCNHQPAGTYRVEAFATTGSSQSVIVGNDMEFLPLSSFEIDFDSVVYDPVAVNVHKWVGGDYDLSTTDAATIWNNGNTYLNLNVMQDDADFGQRTVGGTPVWNVHWDARLGPERAGGTVNYEPNELAFIPGVLVMCTPTKLDFSILVDKAPAGAVTYSGDMTLGATVQPFGVCP